MASQLISLAVQISRWCAGLLRRHGLFLLSVALLGIGFAGNGWRAADAGWFADFQHDSEAAVIGRMVATRDRGLEVGGGFLGYQFPYTNTDAWVRQQYCAYTLTFTRNHAFYAYTSQIGLQGITCALLDQALGFLGPDMRLTLLNGLDALLLAGIFAVLLGWAYREWGATAYVLMLLALLLNPWLTVMARNLFWAFWLMYLPMVLVLLALDREARGGRWVPGLLFGGFALAMLVKCACGYEYVTTILLAAGVPLLYYAIRDRWPARRLAGRVLLIGVAGLLGLGLALGIHLAQLTAHDGGNMGQAVGQIANRLFTRALPVGNSLRYVHPMYYASLWATPREILRAYSEGIGLGTRSGLLRVTVWFPFLFWWSGVLALGVLALVVWRRVSDAERRRLLGLLAATALGVLAALSWLLLFRGHSAIHTHINFVLWSLPALPLMAAMTGYILTVYNSAQARRAADMPVAGD